jgi:hypothetical protein
MHEPRRFVNDLGVERTPQSLGNRFLKQIVERR